MTTTESFFSLLKSHREAKGVEIQEIAEYTKINPKYLHAIESGDFKVLPNVYMRLFLRSYAQFIGADAEQALDDYELHTTGKVSVKMDNMPESSSEITSKELNGVAQILGDSPISPKQIMAGLAVVLGIFFFFNLVSSLTEQQVEIPPEIKTEIQTEVEEATKVETITVNPNEVEKKLDSPTETTETPDEDVKKKP
jgi:cytoskeletal protein RodZ